MSSQTLPITVDKSVPSQRAVVGIGGNGVPIINIARPTADGVSNNRFKQFNVGPSGVVFNNGGAPSHSQLAGAIAGNPLLGNSRAAVILNQVTTNNPSQLRGMMEVAGHRANVIIANPAGIVCDGCGFLNAHRGTLTTGRPMIGVDGGLHGFDVTRGRLSVEGLGLLGNGVDKVDLIARTLTLNAAVWANRLNVVAGPATVGYGDDSVHAKAGEGPAPAVWLDMAALGGMYANSVRLIGTEAGVGVNIGGKLTSLTGDLHITSAGDVRILLAGDVYGAQGLNLSADGNLAVLGKATAQRDVQLTARQGLRVDGVVATADGAGLTLNGHDINIGATGTVHSGATLIADARGRLDTAGDIRATGDLTLKSVGAMALAGSTASHSGNVHLQSLAQDIAMTPSAHTQAVGTLNVAAQGTLLADGELRAGQSVSLRAGGNLETRAIVYGSTDVTLASSGALVSRGTIVAGQFATLHADGRLEHHGKLEAETGLKLTSAGALINGGDLWTGKSATLHADRGLENRGTLWANTGMTLTSNGALMNIGELLTPQAATLRAQGKLENRGTFLADGGATLWTSGALINRGALVASNDDVQLNMQGALDNRDGTIRSGGRLYIGGIQVENQGGAILGHDLEIKTPGRVDNTEGLISGGKSLKIIGETLRNIDGVATSHGTTRIDVGTLENQRGEIWSGNGSSIRVERLTGTGRIASQGDIDFESKESLHHAGEITANGNVSVTIAHGDLHNSGTISSGRNATVNAHNVTNDGQIVSHSTAKVRAKGQLSNEGLINGIDTELGAQSIKNTGRIYGDWVKIEADALRNGPRQHDTGKNRKVGAIAAHERIDMGVDTFDNDHGHVYSGGDLNIGRRLDNAGNAVGKAGVFNNRSGLIDVDGNLRFEVDVINNLNEHFVSEVVPGTTTRKVYYRRDGKNEKLDADKYWLCNYDKPVCSKNYKWLLRTPQRRLLMPSKQEKYNEPQYGPQLSYANRKHESLRRSQAPVQLPYSPPYELELSGRNYITVPEQFHYKIDAPIWDVFDVPRPAPLPEPPPNPGHCSFDEQCRAQREAYEKAHKAKVAAYQELNKQVRAFNRDFKSRLVGRFTIYDVNETVSESRMVSSDPARILVGGNATFNGRVLNDKSQIIAGGDLHTVGGQVRNIGATGERRTEATEKVIRTYTSNGGRKRKTADYHDAPRIEPIELAVATYDGNTPKPAGKGANLATGPGATASNPSETFSLHRAGIGEVRTVAPPTSLPTSALYTLALEANSSYLVNTDDHFVGQRPVVSSDYLFELLGSKVSVGGYASPAQPNALRFARPHSGPSYVEGFNGALLLKRLGDAFYEQRLVARQIMDATGQRFIGDYTDNQSQYKALLTAGAAFGKQYGLTVGTALTEDQMRHLTSDMVWMVKRDVRLPDGTTQTVLAPQVYLMVQQGDLKGDGTLMAGRRLSIDADDRAENSGTIAARDAVLVTAKDIVNRDGGTLRADTVDLRARQDLANLGATLHGKHVLLDAGRDVNLMSTTGESAASASPSAGRMPRAETRRTYIGGVSHIDAQALNIRAGRDVDMNAAMLDIDGDARIKASNDINLLTVRETHDESVIYKRRNNSRVEHTTDVGTVIQANGSLNLSAGRDMNATAAEVSTGGRLAVDVGRDVNLLDGRETGYARDEHYEKSKSGWATVTEHRIDTTESDQSRASTFTGDSVDMHAGRDIRVQGSNVGAQGDLTVRADRDVVIDAVRNTSAEDHYRLKKKSGWGATGGLGKGMRQSITTLEGEGGTYTPSVVGSVDGNVRIDADGGVGVKGSRILANKGDIDIVGRDIDISTVIATDREKRFHEFKESGFRITVDIPVLNAIESIDRMAEASSTVDNPIMKALALGAMGGIAANTAQDTTSAPGGVSPENAASTTITLDYGTTRNSTTMHRNATDVVGSTVAAGRNLSLIAKGAGEDSDITVTGSTVSAGGKVKLDAEGDLLLQAAANTAEQRTEHSNIDGKIGVGVMMGASGGSFGYGFVAKGSVAASKGWTEGLRTEWVNASVVGNEVSTRSGGDTSLIGATVKGDRIKVTADGNLLLESLQDEHTYDSRSMFARAGFTVCWGYCTSSGYANTGLGQINSNYQSVIEQTGIWAGADGFDIHIGKNTRLKGAVIASDQQAVDADLNRLNTGTLVLEDIENVAKYDAFQVSAGAGSGGGGVGMSMPGGALAFDNARSTTHSAISGGAITIRDMQGQVALTGNTVQEMFASLERDTSDTTNTLRPIFDREKVQAGLDIATEATRQAATFLANKAREADAIKKELDNTPEGPKRDALLARYAEVSKWGEGGEYRKAVMVVQAVLAAASGNAAAGVGQFVQAATVNYLQALGAEKIKKLAETMGGEGSPAHIALHSILACSGAAGQGAKCGAGALGAASGIVAEKLISNLTETPSDKLNNEEREQRKNAILNVVAGLGAALDPRNAPTAITAARIELENNTLSVQEHQTRIQETMQCNGVKTCKQRVTEKYVALSQQRRQAVAQCTGSEDCLGKQREHRELAAAYAQRIEELQNKVESWTPAERHEWEALSAMSLLPIVDGNTALKKATEFGPSDTVNEVVRHELGQAVITSAAGMASAAGMSTRGAGIGVSRKNADNEVESGKKGLPVVDDFIPPGMNRPFRAVNPDFPPNKSVIDAMKSPVIKNMTAYRNSDCSEIADKLFDAAGGKGGIVEVRPKRPGSLNLFENGSAASGQFYHQVYTDNRYVYDPRLSSNPIPKGDWEQHIKGMNPQGVTISDRLKGLK